jgi:Sec-independent protein translocase protein TatA
MNTNFFTQLAQLDIKGQFVLIVAKGDDNNLIVSTLVRPLSPADANKSPIIPYNLTANAEDLDTLYFERITEPVKKAGEIIDNLGEFMKSIQNATAKPNKDKNKALKPQGEIDKRTQKYEDAMKKADELEKQGKYSDAWTALPKSAEYPEHADLIKKRQDGFEQKIWPDLFGTNSDSEEEQKVENIVEENT